ncbi:MAG: carbamoyltransferase HypF [Comamonadaceae bacterium CG2_30_59_20]|nr:MAG: carbamoyltransferase HypF [Comamonadaceae bacterium CG2_30_59_20]
MAEANLLSQRVRVTGVVQGVGFRPFVWHLAQKLGLSGWVRNDAQGVEILAQGSATALAELLTHLRTDAPPLARVDGVQVLGMVAQSTTSHPNTCENLQPTTTRTVFTTFNIIPSQSGQAASAIGPDVAVCDACLSELFDPANRRYRHGFITCTHCGPRYTVTRALPYDRPQTSMANFPFCPACGQDYIDPANRRFHAETTCCPQCGPHLHLSDALGLPIAGDSIACTLALLRSGQIVAIKGLGGFHLACDARNAAAVARLRLRKSRDAKPFAVMLANAASVAPFAQAADTERTLLQSRERPIVLLPTTPDCAAALPGIAPGLHKLGVMLPITPIHFLLFHEAAGRPNGTAWLDEPQALVLVMTSANPGGEPIVRDTAEAHTRLAGIADAFLDHNRDILARCDDSVLQLVAGTSQFIRRSRGFAPAAIALAQTGPSVLAFGSHLKNTICVTRGAEAFLSPHIGSLDNAASCQFQDETVQSLCDLLDVKPHWVAHDLHPDDYSTRAAINYAERHGLPTVAVQHHHAHIAAVCAEHNWQRPLLGLALDGFGLGSDGTAWGGELLQVTGAQCQRLGHLRPLPLPGGDRAAREPWRMAAAVLHALGRHAEIVERFQDPAASTVAAMLARSFNSPPTSSLGRVFDAAAGMLGISHTQAYEAQAAILLEQAATQHIQTHGWPSPMPGGYVISSNAGISASASISQLDLLPVLAALSNMADHQANGHIGQIDHINHAAALFHATLLAALTEWVLQAAKTTGLRTLACGGGCFLNALLAGSLQQNLEQNGIQVLLPRRTSPGDASIALGQAWVALHSLETTTCV